LPRTLLKPKFRQVSREAIVAVAPELAPVPLPYIIQSLKTIGPNMMAALSRTTAPAPMSLPRELTVSVKQEYTMESSSTSFDPPPTHLLAVYARADASIATSKVTPRRKVTLFPTHAIVLAAHCAHLPTLRPSKLPQIFRSPERTEDTNITLPIVPLCIPSPSMFPVLQAYLYTKRADHLLGALVPNPAHGPVASASELIRQLAETQPIYTLMRAALRTHELWANAAALGVFDERLWLTISFAWHVLLGAL
ncbi:hypothetical protein BU17DRAFT_16394, partial [Hysterangium stoloniferum]